VGSVLLDRMDQCDDFLHIHPHFFSTSNPGLVFRDKNLLDAYNLNLLISMDVIITCQGSAYTQKVHGPLRDQGWKGYWIDASSELRLNPNSVIALDPVNGDLMNDALKKGSLEGKLYRLSYVNGTRWAFFGGFG